MAFFSEARWTKIALCILLVSFFLHLICFGSTHWARTNTYKVSRREHYGLWRYCTYPKFGSEQCNAFINITTSDWLNACQAFITLSFFTYIFSIVVTGLYSFMSSFHDNKLIIIVGVIFTFATTLFNLIGISVFGVRFQGYFDDKEESWNNVGQLSWSFNIAIAQTIGSAMALCSQSFELLRYYSLKSGHKPYL